MWLRHVGQSKLFLSTQPARWGSGEAGGDYVINATDSCEPKPATLKMVYFFPIQLDHLFCLNLWPL